MTAYLIDNGTDSGEALLRAQLELEAEIVQQLLARRLAQPEVSLMIAPEVELSTETLSDFYQNYLDTQEGGRRRRGSFYTPSVLVEIILDRLFNPEARSVLDPACGVGAFLSGALQRFLKAGLRPEEALSRLHGGDLDGHAARLCRFRLALEAMEGITNPTMKHWRDLMMIAEERIHNGDALLELDWEQGFDLVIGNPPFISAREMARAGMAEYRIWLASRFKSARGAFDLGAVFVERGLELIRPDGKLGLVVPHKLFAAEYGASLRELLAQTCPNHEVLDISREKHFPGAMVYPQILLAGSSFPEPQSVETDPGHEILRRIDSRSVPLGSLCRIRCGTAGFNAAKTAGGLSEGCPESETAWPFIVTRNIDRYRILSRPVHYQHRRFESPFLRDDPGLLSEDRRELFSSHKIVVAGMVKRLEAAFDAAGHALGVNVYGLTDWITDPFFLLAVMNSAIASYYYRKRFADKHLASDFMAINKGPLSQLAIPEASPELVQKLSELGRMEDRASADAEIDRVLFEFFEMDESQRARIRAEFS